MRENTEAKVTKKVKRKKKIKKQSKRSVMIIFIVTLLIFFAMIAFVVKRVYHDNDGNWIAALMGHDKNTLENLEEFYVLVMGESTGMSDTMIVCSYDPKTQEASMLSIPRDTFIGDSEYSANTSDKINSLYSSGETPEKTIEAINEITGLNIKYYVLIDTAALRELVDIIGGVEFDVPIDMKYDDNGQNLHIDLKAGVQMLDGDKAEQVVRFRHNNDGSTYSFEYGIEDYGRMKTQRALLTAILKQTIQFKNITEISEILDLSEKYVKTNLDFSLAKDYIPYIINLDVDKLQAEQLPGVSKKINGIWFFKHDEEETEEMVYKMFLKEASDEATTEEISE